MMFILTVSFLFLTGSLAGWVIEVFFRRTVSQKRWMNPGFLNGPYLPLYGFSTVALYYLSSLTLPLIVKLVVLLCAATALELITGLLFLQVFNIRLWDYSDQLLNFRGVICPVFSLFWGMLSAVFYLLLYPVLHQRLVYILSHLELSFFIGVLFGVLMVDVIHSFDVASQIRRILKEREFRVQVNYERLKLEVNRWAGERSLRPRRSRYLFPFSGRRRAGIRDTIEAEILRMKQGERSRKGLLKIRRILNKVDTHDR